MADVGFRAQNDSMTAKRARPASGDVFVDVRDDSRAMRVSTHRDGDIVVFSIWRGNTCTASFRLDQADVPALIDSLVRGLACSGTGTSPELLKDQAS
jgi:hypothetical protein